MKQRISAVLAILTSLLLTSCIEFEQALDLKSNGSGEIEFVISTPEMDEMSSESEGFMSDEEASEQAQASGVEILENSITKANGRVINKLRVAFDDMEELNAFMARKDGEEENSAEFKFSLSTEGSTTTLRHQVVPDQSEGEDDENAMGEAMLAGMFKDSFYEINWTLPSDVLSASDGATIEGNKVSFKIPFLATIQGSGVDVSASFKSQALPQWAYFAIGGTVLVLILIFLPKAFKK